MNFFPDLPAVPRQSAERGPVSAQGQQDGLPQEALQQAEAQGGKLPSPVIRPLPAVCHLLPHFSVQVEILRLEDRSYFPSLRANWENNFQHPISIQTQIFGKRKYKTSSDDLDPLILIL